MRVALAIRAIDQSYECLGLNSYKACGGGWGAGVMKLLEKVKNLSLFTVHFSLLLAG